MKEVPALELVGARKGVKNSRTVASPFLPAKRPLGVGGPLGEIDVY